jgi:hypothetical protein
MAKRKDATLYVDQYGSIIVARTVAELREKAGGGRVSRMFADRGDDTYHVGYVVGGLRGRWFRAFTPRESLV